MPYFTKHAKWGITKFSFIRYRGGAAGRAEGFAVRPRFGNAGREWWREAERMKGRGVTPHLHVGGEVPEEG
jgi:hypothetical protein